jgi:hypothetical protein
MKTLLWIGCLLVAAALAFQEGSPRMTTVTPDTAKAGAELTVTGENLDKAHVAEVYLTDGKNDLKCDLLDQQPAQIKVKAPGAVKPGRFSLMILTADRARFLEQPVKVTIE